MFGRHYETPAGFESVQSGMLRVERYDGNCSLDVGTLELKSPAKSFSDDSRTVLQNAALPKDSCRSSEVPLRSAARAKWKKNTCVGIPSAGAYRLYASRWCVRLDWMKTARLHVFAVPLMEVVEPYVIPPEQRLNWKPREGHPFPGRRSRRNSCVSSRFSAL